MGRGSETKPLQGPSPSFLFPQGSFSPPLRWEVVGKNLLAMAVQGPLFLLFMLLLQHHAHLLPLSVGIRAGWQGLGPASGPLMSLASDPS